MKLLRPWEVRKGDLSKIEMPLFAALKVEQAQQYSYCSGSKIIQNLNDYFDVRNRHNRPALEDFLNSIRKGELLLINDTTMSTNYPAVHLVSDTNTLKKNTGNLFSFLQSRTL